MYSAQTRTWNGCEDEQYMRANCRHSSVNYKQTNRHSTIYITSSCHWFPSTVAFLQIISSTCLFQTLYWELRELTHLSSLRRSRQEGLICVYDRSRFTFIITHTLTAVNENSFWLKSQTRQSQTKDFALHVQFAATVYDNEVKPHDTQWRMHWKF